MSDHVSLRIMLLFACLGIYQASPDQTLLPAASIPFTKSDDDSFYEPLPECGSLQIEHRLSKIPGTV